MISPPASLRPCAARPRMCSFFSRSTNSRALGLKLSSSDGFTMVEILMVTAIIGVLVLLAIPGYLGVQDSARTARAEGEIRDLDRAITAYAIDHGDFPSSLSIIGRMGAKDPWGHEYIYTKFVNASTPRMKDYYGTDPLNSDFDLYSAGADGRTKDLSADIDTDTSSLDDIVRGGDGGFVGEARKYQPAL